MKIAPNQVLLEFGSATQAEEFKARLRHEVGARPYRGGFVDITDENFVAGDLFHDLSLRAARTGEAKA